MKKPSFVGESAAVIAVLNYIFWSIKILPEWSKWFLIPFGFLFVIDWMMDGVSDKGICKRCFK